jgi:hypothetical protein
VASSASGCVGCWSLITGVVLLVPPQVYYSVRADAQDPRSLLFSFGRLWFLYHLLVYRLLLPVFLWLRREPWAAAGGVADRSLPAAAGNLALALPILLFGYLLAADERLDQAFGLPS